MSPTVAIVATPVASAENEAAVVPPLKADTAATIPLVASPPTTSVLLPPATVKASCPLASIDAVTALSPAKAPLAVIVSFNTFTSSSPLSVAVKYVVAVARAAIAAVMSKLTAPPPFALSVNTRLRALAAKVCVWFTNLFPTDSGVPGGPTVTELSVGSHTAVEPVAVLAPRLV